VAQPLKISVALCSYNGEAFLGEQLESIARQGRRPDELVVVDDGSEDGSVQLVREFAKAAGFPVKLIINEENLGITKNFEKAFMNCSGDIIVCSDQDDVWLCHKLASIEKEFVWNPPLGLVFSDAEVVDAKKRPLDFRLWQQVRFTGDLQRRVRRGDGFRVILKNNVVTGATMAFSRRYLDLLLPFPDSWLHDEWLALIVSAVARVGLIEDPLLLYRQHQHNQVGAREKTFRVLADGARRFGFDVFNVWAEKYDVAYRHIIARVGGNDTLVHLIRHKIRHMLFRANLPRQRMLRVIPVGREFLLFRYNRFSTGYTSALRDLWL